VCIQCRLLKTEKPLLTGADAILRLELQLLQAAAAVAAALRCAACAGQRLI
jgi:hypothetical protein